MQGAAGASILLGGSLLALLFSSVLLIPLGMALWFAPMLVLFNGMPPIEACSELQRLSEKYPAFPSLQPDRLCSAFSLLCRSGWGFV